MKSKFLTTKERAMIQSFLKSGLPSSDLKTLKNKKNGELIQCLDSLVPNQAVSWRIFLVKNAVTCPLDVFLKTLKDLINDTELPSKIEKGKRFPATRDSRLSLLEELNVGLSEHGYPCKCCPVK